jgi:hypothetical protein
MDPSQKPALENRARMKNGVFAAAASRLARTDIARNDSGDISESAPLVKSYVLMGLLAS